MNSTKNCVNSFSVGNGIGPETVAPERLAVSTISQQTDQEYGDRKLLNGYEFFLLPLFSLLRSPISKIDLLHGNFPTPCHGKAGCVSNLPLHRSQRPTLSIIQCYSSRCKHLLFASAFLYFCYYTWHFKEFQVFIYQNSFYSFWVLFITFIYYRRNSSKHKI